MEGTLDRYEALCQELKAELDSDRARQARDSFQWPCCGIVGADSLGCLFPDDEFDFDNYCHAVGAVTCCAFFIYYHACERSF